MPVEACSVDGRPGYRWGNEGKCYTYSPNNESSRREARRRAITQGIAVGDFDKEAFALEIQQHS